MPRAMSGGPVVTVSWQDVHRDIRMLARRLGTGGPWQGIVAITRGGLVPAAVLARELDIRLVDTLCIASYDDRVRGAVDVRKTPERALADGGAGWLLIDDIVDTGATVRAARDILPRAHFATVYAKPDSRDLVDTFLHEVDRDTWVAFPWDADEDAPPPPRRP